MRGNIENLTVEINPVGRNTEEKLSELVRQLRLQNGQLKRIIEDLYLKINKESK